MRPPEKPAPSLQDFLPVAEVGAIRSKLGRWLALNRVGFGQMLAEYRPRWEALVDKFIAEKLIEVSDDYWSENAEVRNRTRKQVIGAARQTWHRVKTAKSPQTASLKSTPPSRARSPASLAPTPIEPDRDRTVSPRPPRYVFVPSTAKKD